METKDIVEIEAVNDVGKIMQFVIERLQSKVRVIDDLICTNKDNIAYINKLLDIRIKIKYIINENDREQII